MKDIAFIFLFAGINLIISNLRLLYFGIIGIVFQSYLYGLDVSLITKLFYI